MVKTHPALLLCLALLAVGGAALSLRQMDRATNQNAVQSIHAPSKTGRLDGPLKTEEPLSRDPATQKLVDRLARISEEWHRNAPPDEDQGLLDKEWSAAAFAEISKLETAQIQALVHVMPTDDCPVPSRFYDYRTSFFRVLGFRDFQAAHSFVEGLSGDLAERIHSSGVEIPATSIRTGQAMRDPEEAWQTFLEEFGSQASIWEAEGLVEIYAAKQPDAAWKTLLDLEYKDDTTTLLDAYLRGKPEGRDWLGMIKELDRSSNNELVDWKSKAFRLLAGAWAESQPGEALAWYEGQLRANAPNEPASEDAIHEELLEALATVSNARVQSVARQLIEDGRRDLVSDLIDLRVRYCEPSDLRLLEVVPLLPSAERRAHLIEKAAQGIVPGPGDPFGGAGWTDQQVNSAIGTLKRLASQAQLIPLFQARVEASIRELEERLADQQKTAEEESGATE